MVSIITLRIVVLWWLFTTLITFSCRNASTINTGSGMPNNTILWAEEIYLDPQYNVVKLLKNIN